ncbi:MAG: cyclopropane fatty acyl phospholipid synthase [Planctomycetia bacterium]|nr:cyclopropane fatty acyl phospholipid synthase [Planctomycetia bacterium]
MNINKSEKYIRSLLEHAGITVNGNALYDIQVHDQRFYHRVIRDGALGLGESYMDGWWDCEAVDQFIDRSLRADLEKELKGNLKIIWHILKSKIFNLQKFSRAFQIGERHYDIGNDLYQAMLDKRMNYTCGYWKYANNLDDAQEAKLDLICKKLELEPKMKILELGCGFGSFAGFAAEKYGVEVLGVTVSKEQVELGSKKYKDLPVELKLMDYRKVTGRYDRVVSIGIMEHVGYKNYRTYMEVADRVLKDNGLAFVHTIGGNVSVTTANAWTTKYIFPNGMLPSIAQLGKAMEGLFIMEDWHNIGPDYDRTLMAWYSNFEKAYPKIKDKYNERFRRMWRFYLLGSAGAFRSRSNQLWQIVMDKQGRNQPVCRFS